LHLSLFFSIDVFLTYWLSTNHPFIYFSFIYSVRNYLQVAIQSLFHKEKIITPE
jgi:hypothetical protein